MVFGASVMQFLIRLRLGLDAGSESLFRHLYTNTVATHMYPMFVAIYTSLGIVWAISHDAVLNTQVGRWVDRIPSALP
jgi:hypothetical protein